MAIVTCEHHKGMGLCRECSERVEASERRMQVEREERQELLAAAKVAKKYGLVLAQDQLERAAFERALSIGEKLYGR